MQRYNKKQYIHLAKLPSLIFHFRQKTHIAQERAPQVLTISHDDVLSEEENSSSDETDGKDEILYSSYDQRYGYGELSDYRLLVFLIFVCFQNDPKPGLGWLNLFFNWLD